MLAGSVGCKIISLPCSIDMANVDMQSVYSLFRICGVVSCITAIVLFLVSFVLYRKYSTRVLHNREVYKGFSGVVEKFENNTNQFEIILGRDKTPRDAAIFRLFVDGVERHLTVFIPRHVVKFKTGDVVDLYLHEDLVRTGISDNANHRGHLLGYNGSSFNGQIWIPKIVNRILRTMIVLGFVLCILGGILGSF